MFDKFDEMRDSIDKEFDELQKTIGSTKLTIVRRHETMHDVLNNIKIDMADTSDIGRLQRENSEALDELLNSF